MGPVYLSLPREILCSRVDGVTLPKGPVSSHSPAVPAATAIEAAANDRCCPTPAPVSQRAGAFPAGFEAAAASPSVRPAGGRVLALADLAVDHPMHAGFDPGAALAEADLILVLDALVPWIPLRNHLPAGCRVIQLGADPLFAATPVRGFPCDLALAGDLPPTLALLTTALEDRLPTTGRAWPSAANSSARHTEWRERQGCKKQKPAAARR